MTVFDLTQMLSFLLILILTGSQHCDQPLKTYLTTHLVNLTLTFPIKIYFHFIEFKSLKFSQEYDAKEEECHDNDETDDDDGDHEPHYQFYLQLFYDFSKTISWVGFVMGNLLVFSSTTCSKTSPLLYFSSLISLTLGYLYLVEIFVILLTLNFFVPIIMFINELINVNKKQKQTERVDQVTINKNTIKIHLTKLDEIKSDYQMFQNERKEFDIELGISHEEDHFWIQSILNQTQNDFKVKDQINEIKLRKLKSLTKSKTIQSLIIIWNRRWNLFKAIQLSSYQSVNQDEKISFQEFDPSYPIEKLPNST